MTLAETYQDTTPEPQIVMISHDRCPDHPDCHFISMPRDTVEGYRGLLEKCPWKFCRRGR